MADLKFSIKFDLSTKLEIMKAVDRQVFPLLNQAVNAIGTQTAINWQAAVYRAKLWSGEKDAYAKTINWKMTGDFSGVVTSDYKYAEEIENGRPARDLKLMLNTSLKVRVNARGVRYLFIPFRHNTPGNDATGPAMPDSIYALAQKLSASTITGQTTRKSGINGSDIKTKQPLSTPQNTYKWGDRLPSGLAPKIKPEHKTDPYAGMVKMNTSTPGGSKSSVYLTFRTMSANSKGWIVPAQPGQHIAEKVVNEMQPKAQAAFAKAIQLTLSKTK